MLSVCSYLVLAPCTQHPGWQGEVPRLHSEMLHLPSPLLQPEKAIKQTLCWRSLNPSASPHLVPVTDFPFYIPNTIILSNMHFLKHIRFLSFFFKITPKSLFLPFHG